MPIEWKSFSNVIAGLGPGSNTGYGVCMSDTGTTIGVGSADNGVL